MLKHFFDIYYINKGLQDRKTTLDLHNESDGNRDPDDEVNDCAKDRKIALEDKSVSLIITCELNCSN